MNKESSWACPEECQKGFNCNTENVSLKEDLKRRDFTINAIAYDILEDEYIDPFDGKEDLKHGLLYPVSTAFKEDPLRVYRAARFAAELGFKLHDTLLDYMEELKYELNTLPIERVFEELKKALRSNHPEKFFISLRDAYVLHMHFKEIYDLIDANQVKKYHPEGDAFNHTMLALKEISKLTDKTYVSFAVLVHDIGKGLTPKEEFPHHYNHSKLGLSALNTFIDRIKFPNRWIKSAEFAVSEHMRIPKWKEMKPGKVVRLFKKIKRLPLTIDDVINIVLADKYGRNTKNQKDICIKLMYFKKLYHGMYKKTSGNDIDQERYSGKEIGEQLFQYRCQWLKRSRKNLLN